MIYFNMKVGISLRNNHFKNLFCREPKISKHKCLCVEMIQCFDDLFALEIDLRWTGSDHAGPKFTLAFFGYSFSIGIYDTRHWDDKTNSWQIYYRPKKHHNKR